MTSLRWTSALLLLTGSCLAALSPACMSVHGADPPVLGTHVTDWRDEVIYQVLVDRFADGDTSNDTDIHPGVLARFQGGDWLGLQQHLDYIQALGVTTLWISPVVKNVETDAGVDGYHGYWAQDLTQPNPHFGSLADLRLLVKACHERGLKVIVDIVTNHMGQLFYYDINENGQPDVDLMGSGLTPDSPVEHITEYDPDFNLNGIQAMTSLGDSGLAPIVFINDPAANKLPAHPDIFQLASSYHRRGRITNYAALLYDANGNVVMDDANPPQPYRVQTELGDFPGGLKDIATEDPAVRLALAQTFEQWVLDTDIDGFRIDTVKHIEHGFWRYFTQAIRSDLSTRFHKDNFLMFGEAFDGDDSKIGSYTAPGELDSVFYFSQYYTVIQGVFQQALSTDRIASLWASRASDWGATPQTNGIGVAPKDIPINFLDNHDVGRFLFFRNDVGALKLAILYNLTLQGIPCVYYGTEQGFSGGNDPANREVLWTTNYDTSGDLFQWISRLTHIRKSYTAFTRGGTNVVQSTSDVGSEPDAGMFAFERTGGDAMQSYALVILNTSPTNMSQTVTLDASNHSTPITVSQAPGTVLVNILDPMQATYTVGSGGSLLMTLPPTTGAILIPQSQLQGQLRVASVSIRGLTKSYAQVPVLRGVDLEIQDGQLCVLVGASGCGKSTLLRCIAGLEEPDSGAIFFDQQDVTRAEPRERDVAMVFQSYALYPHLSVRENLAFGLRLRRTPALEISARVKAVSALLGLDELLERLPRQLSGGQRQRVAMGRALVRNPRLFLFDEPLSNLDAALRGQVRVDIQKLHHRLGATMVYVTHDQIEAMTLADRMVILNQGRIEQQGAPLDLYRQPASRFVGQFLGTPPMSVLSAKALSSSRVSLSSEVQLDVGERALVVGQSVAVGFRAEDLSLCSDGPLRGAVDAIEALGSETFAHLSSPMGPFVVRLAAQARVQHGEELRIAIAPEAVHVFDEQGKRVAS